MPNLKKLFISSMIVAVTAWAMGLAAIPMGVSAASAGDLIKMDGLSSVYYLGADGKRYVFPNETTYFSWYSDFSSVVTVSQSELESYPLGSNVTIRPGTKLVKITTDPKVYAVEPNGVLKHIATEDAAKKLYGDNWAKRVVDVPDAFFTNYTVSSDSIDGTTYPVGSLIKYAGSSDVYYVDSTGKRKVKDEAAFTANRFQWSNIITAPSDITMNDGPELAGVESSLIDTSQGGGAGSTVVTTGTGLTVALADDTPASRNIPSNSALVPFITVNLTASTDGAVAVQNMVFKRTGVGDPTNFNGGYLFANNTRLSNKSSVNSSDNTITFNALNLNIPAGTTKKLTLKMNINKGVAGNHAFELASTNSVTTDGAAVSGSFPIIGNLMYLSAVNAGTVTFAGVVSGTTRKIGETNVILGEFTIANDNSEIVNINRIMLKNEGTASDDAIKNLSLDLDGTVVKTGVSMSNKLIDFTLDKPFSIDKGKTITATIRGDVVGGIGKTVQFYLKNVADVDVRGTAYGDFYSATVTNNFTAGTGSEISIQGSEIDVSFDGPQASDIKDDTKDVVLANFKIKSNNLGVNIDTLPVTLAMDTASTTANPNNCEMVDSGNNMAYSVSDPTTSTTTHTLDFENINLAAGKQYNFQIRCDIPDLHSATGETYIASINFASGFVANFTDSDETAVDPAKDLSQISLTGKPMTIAAPTITLSSVQTNNVTAVKEAKGVLLYKGKLTANNVDDLKVSKIGIAGKIGDTNDNDGFSQDWTKLYLYKVNSDGTETKLDDETSLDNQAVSFTGFTLNVPKGLSNGVYIVVRGDVKSSPIATTTVINLPNDSTKYTVRDSNNNTVTATGDAVNGHITTVVGAGTYTMVMDTEEAGVNANQNVLAGSVVKVGRIKLTAANENAVLKDLVLQNLGTATNATISQLYLYADKDLSKRLATADVGTGANPEALFQDMNISIPTAGVTYIYVAANVKGIDYSSSPTADATAEAGTTIQLTVPNDSGDYTTKVVSANSGDTLTASSGGNGKSGSTKISTVLGAVMSAISTDFDNGTLTNGTARDIFSFKVTAPSSNNVAYDGTDLGFRLATTTLTYATSGPAALTISNIRVERVGGTAGEVAADGHAVITSTGAGAGTIAIGFNDMADLGTDRIVRPGTTAEYVIRADVSGSDGSGDSLQVTLENINSSSNPSVKYLHSKTDSTTFTSEVAPLISGVTSVRGGTLSN